MEKAWKARLGDNSKMATMRASCLGVLKKLGVSVRKKRGRIMTVAGKINFCINSVYRKSDDLCKSQLQVLMVVAQILLSPQLGSS